MTDALERLLHDFDVCKCGDYRMHHIDGTSECKLNGLGHGGLSPCYRFRLASRALEGEDGR